MWSFTRLTYVINYLAVCVITICEDVLHLSVSRSCFSISQPYIQKYLIWLFFKWHLDLSTCEARHHRYWIRRRKARNRTLTVSIACSLRDIAAPRVSLGSLPSLPHACRILWAPQLKHVNLITLKPQLLDNQNIWKIWKQMKLTIIYMPNREAYAHVHKKRIVKTDHLNQLPSWWASASECLCQISTYVRDN